jgi:hypothetical protein
MLTLKVKIEEPEKMKALNKVMISFNENKKVVEEFQSLEKLNENGNLATFNTQFIEKVQKLFDYVFGSGFPRSNDEYYKYLHYYETKNKQNSDNRDFTEEGWTRFFQHHSFKNLQKHIRENFNHDIKKINQDLPKWFVCFLGMCLFENN